MEVYKILVPKNFKDFGRLCDYLGKLGKYSISSQYLVFLAERKNIKNIESKYKVAITPFLNYAEEINSLPIKKWIAQELFNHSQQVIREEAQERINAMHEILKSANEIIKGGCISENAQTEKNE